MKTILQKPFFSILVIILILMISIFAYNSNTSNVITIEEYEAALQAEAAKYGVEVEILEYDPNKKITQADLDRAIENLKKSVQANDITAE